MLTRWTIKQRPSYLTGLTGSELRQRTVYTPGVWCVCVCVSTHTAIWMGSCRLKEGRGSQGEQGLKRTVRTVKVKFSRKYMRAICKGNQVTKKKFLLTSLTWKTPDFNHFASLRPIFKGLIFFPLEASDVGWCEKILSL